MGLYVLNNFARTLLIIVLLLVPVCVYLCFNASPWVYLLYVIMAFPGHIHMFRHIMSPCELDIYSASMKSYQVKMFNKCHYVTCGEL